jgi:threonine/homoserine/homoserine lactone efflux protein
LAYLAAVLLVVIAPGPDNILAIGRGLSQGWVFWSIVTGHSGRS